MSRISFLVGYDRIAQSPSGPSAECTDTEGASTYSRHALSKQGEEHLTKFWEDTRIGLVRRMREKNEQEAELEAGSHHTNLNMFATSQIKKRMHTAKIHAARKTRFLLHPHDSRKLYWDLFVGGMIVYSVALIPWRIAFKQDAQGGFWWFERIVDTIFAVDILLCFNSAYFEGDVLVYSRPTIAKRYLATWFVPDFLGTIPLSSLIHLFIQTVSPSVQGVKLIRAVRLTRLLKLMRILRLSRNMAHVDITRHVNPSVVRLVKLLGKIVFAAHLLACMWSMVDECVVEDNGEFWKTCGGSSLQSKYLASLYWTIATLMSVGYGDISANTNQERLYALVTMVIGSTAFGFIIAMVTVIVETMDPQATAKSAKMDEVREYMGVRKLSKVLQVRIRKHFDHVYGNMSVFKEIPILRDLPYSLRLKLAYDTHEDLMHTLFFFEGLDVAVITEMVYRLKPMQLRRKEYLGKAGEILDEVFFVIKGRVEARHSKPGKHVLVALHSDGSDFELSSLVLCRPMQFTYRAVVQSDLMWLDKDDLENITTEYTNADESITEKAERQHMLLTECLSLEEVSGDNDLRQAMVIVDWRLFPATDVSHLMDDALKGVILDRNGPVEDTDDTTAMIRTIRPITPAPNASPCFGLRIKSWCWKSMRGFSDTPNTRRETADICARAAGGGEGTTLGSAGGVVEIEGGGSVVGEEWGEDKGVGENFESISRKKRQHTGGQQTGKQTVGVGVGTGKEESLLSKERKVGLVALNRTSFSNPQKQKEQEEEDQRRDKLDRTPANMEECWETPESVSRRWVILPNASWKHKWDIFAAILIATSIIVVPFRIGFDSASEGGWVVVDLVTDLAFALDIILNFRTACMSGQVLVTSPSLMAKRYLTGWFAIDLLSTVPFDRIMSLSMEGGSSKVFRGLKLVKVARMVRLLRLFRLLKIARFQVLAEEFMELNTVLFRGLKLVLTLALLGHFFGCFWSFVSRSGVTAAAEGGDDDGGLSSTWWGSLGLLQEDLAGRYIASIYWAFTTMTTTGYGDVVPVVDRERAYATIIMVIGATVFGYIVGSVSALASNPNGSQARETKEILEVSNYLDEKHIQQKLQQAVKKHVGYFLSHKSSFDEESLLALIPPSLREESILQIHKDVVGKIPIFKHLNKNHTAYVLRHMTPYFCVLGNLIYTPTHGSDGVYFLLQGKAETVDQPEGKDRPEKPYTVTQGQFFGHEIFVNPPKLGVQTDADSVAGSSSQQQQQQQPRERLGLKHTGMRALTDCSMFVLTESKILDLVDKQPDLGANLQRALRKAIDDHDQSMRDASSRRESIPLGSHRHFVDMRAMLPQRDLGAVEAGKGEGESVLHRSSSNVRGSVGNRLAAKMPTWRGNKVATTEGVAS